MIPLPADTAAAKAEFTMFIQSRKRTRDSDDAELSVGRKLMRITSYLFGWRRSYF